MAVYIIISVMHGHTNIKSQFQHRHIFEVLISYLRIMTDLVGILVSKS